MLSIVYQLPLCLHQLHKIILDTRPYCKCRTPLWSRGNITASHLAGAELVPGRVSFPGWGFSSTVRHMKGKLRRHQSPGIIGHQTLLFRAVPILLTSPFQVFIVLLPSAAVLRTCAIFFLT